MSTAKRGLGKGLEALLSSTSSVAQKDASAISAGRSEMPSLLFSGKTIVTVNASEIVPNPRQPRHSFHDESLAELADSIKEHGIAQPLLVRKKGIGYELIAGERRLRAAKLAGLTKVPVVIRDMSDEESLEIAIIENVQREDLNPIDEAESYQLLMSEFSFTQEQVAKKVGKSRPAIANALRLNALPPEIKQSLRNAEISAGHARAILAAGNYAEQLRVWEKIKREGLNVRDAEKSSAKTSKTKKAFHEKPYALSTLERELSGKLATKVEIHGSEQKGSITIKYFSRDELDRIYAMLADDQVI